MRTRKKQSNRMIHKHQSREKVYFDPYELDDQWKFAKKMWYVHNFNENNAFITKKFYYIPLHLQLGRCRLVTEFEKLNRIGEGTYGVVCKKPIHFLNSC